VYEAEQLSLGRRVALKVLPALPAHGLAGNDELRRRFQREARVAASLQHPNIVPVFSVGEEQGLQYYAMQYAQAVSWDRLIAWLARNLRTGETPDLAALVGRLRHASPGGELEPEVLPPRPGPGFYVNIATLTAQIADALAFAHAQGAVHRDIKPANLLLDARSIAMITDFGLARFLSAGSAVQTTGLTGTLRYMAPEQFDGQAGPRSDIYSLGLSLYEFATLCPAFRGRTAEIVRSIFDGTLRRPRTVAPWVPEELESIILKAAAHDQDARYATAADMAAALRAFAARSTDGNPSRLDVRDADGAFRPTRKPLLWPLVAAVALLGLLLFVGLSRTNWMSSQSAPQSAAFPAATPPPAAQTQSPHASTTTQITEPESAATRPEAASTASALAPEVERELPSREASPESPGPVPPPRPDGRDRDEPLSPRDEAFPPGRPPGDDAGPAGRHPPAEAVAACQGKRLNDACRAHRRSGEIVPGICNQPPDGRAPLACQPRERPHSPPPEAVDACRGLRQGAPCRLTDREGASLRGFCTMPGGGGAGVLFCRP